MHSGFTWPLYVPYQPVEAGVGNLVLNQGGGSVDEHGQSRTFAVGE